MIGKTVTAAAFVFILMAIVSCWTTISDALLTCKDEPRYTGRFNVSASDLLELTDKVALPVPIAEPK